METQGIKVRRIGIDISQARLELELLNLGIKANYNDLTQADKALLRYIAVMKQSGNAMGNMGRELITPANAIRVLQAQIQIAGRAIGSIFIPALIKILPIAIAVTKIIGEMAAAFARFVGFEMPEIDYSSVGQGITGISDGLDDTADSAKEAKKQMAQLIGGFDELNVYSKDKSKTDDNMHNLLGGITLPEYNMFEGIIETEIDEWVEKLSPKLESVLKVVVAIGIAFGTWKIAKGISDFLTGASVGTGLLGRVKDLWKIFSSPSGKVEKLTSMFGSWTAYLSPAAAKVLTIAGLAGTIAIMVTRFIDLYQNSEKFRLGLEKIGEVGGKVFGWLGDKASGLGEKFKDLIPESVKVQFNNAMESMSKVTDALDLDFADLLITLGGIGLLFTPLAPFGVALLGFEAATIAIRGIGYAASDVIEPVDLFVNGISEITQAKLEPFLKEIDGLDQTLKTLKWSGKIIEQSDVDNIKTQVESISKIIIDELDADKNTSMQKLDPLKNIMANDDYNEIVKSTDTYYNKMKDEVANGEKEINQIISDMQEGKITNYDEAYKRIDEITAEMKKTGIKHLSESEREQKLIMERLKNSNVQLSAIQASEIVKNSLNTKNETIENAKKQFDEITFEYGRMHEIGVITDEQYANIIEAAKLAKDETISAAEEQHRRIVEEAKLQSGELVNEIDWTTGEIRSKWDVFWEDTQTKFSEGWDELTQSIELWWTEDVAPWFTIEQWQTLGENMKQGIMTKWTEFKDWWDKSALVVWWRDSVAPYFTKKKWLDIWSTAKDGFIQGGKDLFNGIIGVVETAINWMINKINSLSWDVPEFVPIWGGKTFGFDISTIKIDRFAKGGVLTEPTVGLMAEYANARSNPEIVTPQNIMYETVVEGTAEGFVAVVEAINKLERTLREKEMAVSIGEDYIGDVAINRINERTLIDGESPI